MNESQLSIQLTIADRSYKFNVKPEDEEVVRLAVKNVNDKVSSYKKKYANCDSQNALAMTVLQLAIKLLEKERDGSANSIVDDLRSLDNQLDKYIEDNNI